MKNKLFLILTNPLFLSLVLTIILLAILPTFFSKYKIDLIKKEKRPPADFTQYCDLNNNGYSEQIKIEKGFKNRTSIIVREKGTTIDQWSFSGKLAMPHLFFGDFNDDNLKEIFLITIYKNKILVNCFNPYKNKKYISDFHIDNFLPRNGVDFCSAEDLRLADISGNKLKEFVFKISAGFPVYPRKIYYYNFEIDSLYKTPESCTAMHQNKLIELKNTDPLFIPSTAAVGNCDSNALYSDQYTWLTVFNSDLNYKFNPVKIGIYPSYLYVAPIKWKNETVLFTLNIYSGNIEIPSSMSLYDLNGNKIKGKMFPYEKRWYSPTLLTKANESTKLYLVQINGNIETIDTAFNSKQICKLLPLSYTKPFQLDIDKDDKLEYIFRHLSLEKITILRNDFSDPVIIDVPGNNNLHYCSVLLNGNKKPQLFLSFDNYSYYYEYYKNPLHNFRFVFYGLIYLGIFGFLFVLQKTQKYRVEQKYRAEKKIAELQIKSIKNQTDPHFTLNIINSIGSLFAKQETDKANYIFGKYSKLLRSTILSSDQILTTIDDEIEYVENYLSLEQFRFKDGFDFKIEKEESINGKIKIPKMLIHTFVENAIKHGIKHIEERGKLFISISNGTDTYKIKIRDNGIGRTKAKEINSFGTGKGLEIMNQILDLYYTLEKVKITYKVEDLTNGVNEPLGTEVLIIIPILKS